MNFLLHSTNLCCCAIFVMFYVKKTTQSVLNVYTCVINVRYIENRYSLFHWYRAMMNLAGLYAHQMGIKYIYIYIFKKTVYIHVASSWHRNSWVCKGRQLHLPIPWTSESAIGIYCLKTGNYFPKGYVG